jgi:serine/threonine protein kinase
LSDSSSKEKKSKGRRGEKMASILGKRVITGEAKGPSISAVDQFWPKFQSIKVLGKGAFGSVSLVESKDSKETVVVKEIKKTADNTNAVALEIAILERLSKSCGTTPSTVCYITSYQDAGSYYILMRFLDKYVDLATYLMKNRKPIDSDKLGKIACQLMQGLKSIHELGVIHRDIKLSNILINVETMCCKFIDFGLACQLPRCSGNPGTVDSKPPEYIYQSESTGIKGAEAWKAVDIWALGNVLFELAIGYNFYARLAVDFAKTFPEIYALFKTVYPQGYWKYHGGTKTVLPLIINTVNQESKENPYFTSSRAALYLIDANVEPLLSMVIYTMLNYLPEKRVMLDFICTAESGYAISPEMCGAK